ncbi:hypothetical protein [Streptomyces sp. NPDC091209]|uniref:hypothetical protein n=1 Tax=Streptomyces sp. NPDC091209 TaxID=3365974 RepID=UPI0038198C88
MTMFLRFADHGLTWETVVENLLVKPLVWGILSLGLAAFAVRSLRRRARATGIALSVGALDQRQTHLLRPVSFSDGWQERVRGELLASKRVFLVIGDFHQEIHFRWRPGRGDRSVLGSMSVDALSGDVVLDVRDDEGLLGVAGLGKGASFTAMCQIAGATGLVSGSARG